MLSNNSYGVYIIHTIVLGGIALTMFNTAIPSLSKHFILTVSTYGASNLIVSLYRKIPTTPNYKFCLERFGKISAFSKLWMSPVQMNATRSTLNDYGFSPDARVRTMMQMKGTKINAFSDLDFSPVE